MGMDWGQHESGLPNHYSLRHSLQAFLAFFWGYWGITIPVIITVLSDEGEGRGWNNRFSFPQNSSR